VSTSASDHPWLSGLLGDDEVAPLFEVAAELAEVIAFERALALAEGATGAIPAEAAREIAARLPEFRADDAAIAAATARDGVIVPELVRQMRAFLGAAGEHLHFGATSQDAIDTSLVRRVKRVLAIFEVRLKALDTAFEALDAEQGGNVVMGRTRMQDAIPLTVSDKIRAWRGPIPRHLTRVSEMKPRLLVVQFGGAVGTLDKLGDKGPEVGRRLAMELELGFAPSWHGQRDGIVELADWLALVSGMLGKFGADIGLLAQMKDLEIAGGGTSSAMGHKHNPVAAEVLVALARHNAALLGGIHQVLVHEQERSGAAWTLEWLLLPPMVMATAASLRLANSLIGQLVRIGKPA
jgi:3-carboxy-cis,cis-muconate cycloisomerase